MQWLGVWFSVGEMELRQADVKVSWTPDMPIVPPVANMPQLLPRTYTWLPDKSLNFPPMYPMSFYAFAPVAVQYGPMKVAFFLGMWPLYKDYVEHPDDPETWPIRGLIVSGGIALQPTLRMLMDYQWRFDYRNRGRRSVPRGYIPMHYVPRWATWAEGCTLGRITNEPLQLNSRWADSSRLCGIQQTFFGPGGIACVSLTPAPSPGSARKLNPGCIVHDMQLSASYMIVACQQEIALVPLDGSTPLLFNPGNVTTPDYLDVNCALAQGNDAEYIGVERVSTCSDLCSPVAPTFSIRRVYPGDPPVELGQLVSPSSGAPPVDVELSCTQSINIRLDAARVYVGHSSRLMSLLRSGGSQVDLLVPGPDEYLASFVLDLASASESAVGVYAVVDTNANQGFSGTRIHYLTLDPLSGTVAGSKILAELPEFDCNGFVIDPKFVYCGNYGPIGSSIVRISRTTGAVQTVVKGAGEFALTSETLHFGGCGRTYDVSLKELESLGAPLELPPCVQNANCGE